MTEIAWLPEPPNHTEKARFFDAVVQAAGAGTPVSATALSWRGYPETRARADACLARAKKQPRGALGRAVKRAFLCGRYNWARRHFENSGATALCWQGLTGTRRAMMLGAQDAGARTFFAELAPFAGYKTLDPRGVNAEGSVPQSAAFYDDVTPDPDLIAALRDSSQARVPRRADVGQDATTVPEGDYIFVPLQVPDDSQMILFAGWVGSVTGFIAALAAASAALPPGMHLRLKEHPSARISLTETITTAMNAGARMVLDNQTDSFTQLRGSQGVLTVNSSMGLQAMLFDLPVIVTGECFYAFDALATRAPNPAALAAALSSAPFDGALRARFLTWLAKVYYIPETPQGYDLDRLRARLAGDI